MDIYGNIKSPLVASIQLIGSRQNIQNANLERALTALTNKMGTSDFAFSWHQIERLLLGEITEITINYDNHAYKYSAGPKLTISFWKRSKVPATPQRTCLIYANVHDLPRICSKMAVTGTFSGVFEKKVPVTKEESQLRTWCSARFGRIWKMFFCCFGLTLYCFKITQKCLAISDRKNQAWCRKS